MVMGGGELNYSTLISGAMGVNKWLDALE